MYWDIYVYLDASISVQDVGGKWEMKMQMGRSLGIWAGLCVYQ